MDIYTGDSTESSRGRGPVPYITDLGRDTINNTLFFITQWSSRNMQLALMSVPAGSDTGLDMHQLSDQLFYIVLGSALVTMGGCQECLDLREYAHDGYAIMVPAGTWHSVANVGQSDLKMFTVYAPAFHSFSAVYETKEDWFGHYDY